MASVVFHASPLHGQCEIERLEASDGTPDDGFGLSIALSGPFAVVGAPDADGGALNSGAAYVYRDTGSEWVEQARLFDSAGRVDDEFGRAVGFDGDTLFIGNPNDADVMNQQGVVHIYQRTSSSWVEIQQLRDTSSAGTHSFGGSLAVNGKRALVTAPRQWPESAINAYSLEGGVWHRAQTLLKSEVAARLQNSGRLIGFSGSYVLDDDLAIVGLLFGSDDSGPCNWGDRSPGAAVYSRRGGKWVLVAAIECSSDSSQGFARTYPYPIARRGSTIAIGDPGHNLLACQAGVVYIYERRGPHDWFLEQSIVASDGLFRQGFGTSVNFDGDRLLVTSGTNEHEPGAFAFEEIGGRWEQVWHGRPETSFQGDGFGWDAAASDGKLVVGASSFPFPDDQPGAVHRFSFPTLILPYCFCGPDEGCLGGDGETGCLNSRGIGAHLTGCGSTSVTRDDLVILADGLPLQEIALLFMGSPSRAFPMGAGLGCVANMSSGLFRFPMLATGSGRLTQGPGLVRHARKNFPAGGQIIAGSSWAFQVTYSDASGGCNTRRNTTNAIEVSFTP